MEEIKSYNSIWKTEIRKFITPGPGKWGLILVVILFASFPWLILRKFEENFEIFKWHYLEESYLYFIISKSGGEFTWMMILFIPWVYYLLYEEEIRPFLKSSNEVILKINIIKGWIYSTIGFLLINLFWISSFLLYLYYCRSREIEMETFAFNKMITPSIHLFLRYLTVFPMSVILFLVLPKKSSYLLLVSILLFASFLIFRIPFHFHYNVHLPMLNSQVTLHALLVGLVFTIGLVVYYRFISKKVNVLP